MDGRGLKPPDYCCSGERISCAPVRHGRARIETYFNREIILSIRGAPVRHGRARIETDYAIPLAVVHFRAPVRHGRARIETPSVALEL